MLVVASLGALSWDAVVAATTLTVFIAAALAPVAAGFLLGRVGPWNREAGIGGLVGYLALPAVVVAGDHIAGLLGAAIVAAAGWVMLWRAVARLVGSGGRGGQTGRR